MYGIDSLAVSESSKRLINIRDANRDYQTAFWLEDGKSLTVIRPDGSRVTETCKYIEPYHFYFGTTCYHIDQFAELVSRNNMRLEPEEYVTDLSLYNKYYMDRTLHDSAGKLIPYRSLIMKELPSRDTQVIGICPDAQIGRQVAFWDGTKDLAKESGTTFYSIAQAKEELLPSLELTIHEQKVLLAIFDEAEKLIPRISPLDYDAIPADYKSTYSNFNGDHPEWEGKRCAFLPGHGTTLFIEGVSFIIDPDVKPTLKARVKAAEKKTETTQAHREEPTQER